MNRALLSAIALCFAAAGCDQKPAEPPKPKTAAAVVPLPPEAPKAAAASAGQDAKPVQVAAMKAVAADIQPTDPPKRKGKEGKEERGGCGNDKCKVKIRVDQPGVRCVVTLNAKDLSVYGPQTIEWHALGGWVFDPNGIDPPAGSRQFTNPRGGGTNKFSWDDANSDKRNYKYHINMKKGSEVCNVDPSILNGADYEEPGYPP